MLCLPSSQKRVNKEPLFICCQLDMMALWWTARVVQSPHAERSDTVLGRGVSLERQAGQVKAFMFLTRSSYAHLITLKCRLLSSHSYDSVLYRSKTLRCVKSGLEIKRWSKLDSPRQISPAQLL